MRQVDTGLAEEARPVLSLLRPAWGTGEKRHEWPHLRRRCLAPTTRTAAAGGGSWAKQETSLLRVASWLSIDRAGAIGDREQHWGSICVVDVVLVLRVI